jgi:hypothetical protein
MNSGMDEDEDEEEARRLELEETLRVALFREANDLRALHKLIGVQAGQEPWKYWDATGVPLTGPVETLLGLCGFGGQRPPRPEVRALEEGDVNVVPLLGFTAPRDLYSEVRTAILAVASGQIGGFAPLMVAQSGFHDAAIDVFAYVWSQVERPPIWVCSPVLGSRGGGTAVPQSILPFARSDIAFRASDYVRNVLRAALGSPNQ